MFLISENNGRSCSARNRNLLKIPTNLPQNVTDADLSGNQFTLLSKLNFSKSYKWQALNLSNSKISVIRAGTFRNLGQLRNLSLNGNPLSEIRGDMWQGLQSLMVLRIRALVNITLHPKAFSNLPSLETMSLDLEHLKRHSSEYIDPSNFPDTPAEQVKFKIEIRGREITCDNSFCFLNNLQKKGLIKAFLAEGDELPEGPVCKIDQNPFWKYSKLNCDSVGE